MPSLSLLTALLLPLLPFSRATPMPGPVPAPIPASCPPLPSWKIHNLTVTYSDESYTPGNATFTLTESVSNSSEALGCEVSFNYRGAIQGTPAHPGLNILLLFGIDTAFVTVNQTWPGDCVSDEVPHVSGMSSFVIGLAEVQLQCPDPSFDGMTCSAKDASEANGVVQVIYPDEPEAPALALDGVV
ncbi:hypothetical protein B0H63DRAFT_98316 [Podospora didyma]|uniref:AA1-like domain-containing protein n=1 Tax=Podospora didyma TaxID=330526 RepID=A0AAE0NX25_9PEZI|nr:hypothetical protein B0H63DRAFT_98316 [Podospora didyma]